MNNDLLRKLRTLREQAPISVSREEWREALGEAIAEIVEQSGLALQQQHRINALDATNHQLQMQVTANAIRDAERAVAAMDEVIPEAAEPEPIGPRRRNLRVT